MNLDAKQWQEIEQIVQLCATHQVACLEVENPSYRICVQAPATTNTLAVAQPTALSQTTLAPEASPASPTITSSHVGRILLSPDAVSPACVAVGQRVEQGDTVAYVAALGKLLPIVSEQAGTIRRICVENQQAIQYGQALFELDA